MEERKGQCHIPRIAQQKAKHDEHQLPGDSGLELDMPSAKRPLPGQPEESEMWTHSP